MSKVRDITAIRNSMIKTAKEREQKLREAHEQAIEELRQAAIAEITRLRDMLNGMTRVLGCIIEQTGELTYEKESELEKMSPGRVYIMEYDEDRGRPKPVTVWTVKLRDDASKPPEVSLVPDKAPDDMLDLDAMERDGVESVPMVPSCNDEAS